MLAMQYSFTFPADYDMARITERIATKGMMTDGYPGLVFKAYLMSRTGDADHGENRYAPFYLWHDNDGMNTFLGSSGFAGLSRSFGWPMVRTWSVWDARSGAAMAGARHASRTLATIARYADLAAVRQQEAEANDSAVREGAVAAISGFEPTSWSLVRFRLWSDRPAGDGADHFDVGHVSLAA